MNNNKGILEARIKQMAEGNYKEMEKEFSLDDFDPKPAETTTQEETEPTENKKPEKLTTNKKKPVERNDPSDMEEYRNRFLVSRLRQKNIFSAKPCNAGYTERHIT